MSVPEGIRAVERPVNTIVEDSGREGAKRYSVRERSAIKYVRGGNPQPRNGKVVGHIVEGRFVPTAEKVVLQPDCRSYGASALVHSVSGDIFDDLSKVYPIDVASQLIAVASLKVLRPSIAPNRYSTHYERTFVSTYHPGVALSKNTVLGLFKAVGTDSRKRRDFYSLRIARVAEDHHIAIDGTLKQDNSGVNDLSAFSYKAKTKGCKDVSVLYAFDIESLEPICAEVFPGNFIDASSFLGFVRDNNINEGILVADKGLPIGKIDAHLRENPKLHYISPMKRDDKRIKAHGLLGFDEVVVGTDKNVVGKKVMVSPGRYLYSFKDSCLAGQEECGIIRNAKKHSNLNPEKYAKGRETYGVIVFESDLDLTLGQVYRNYEDRWLLELLFSQYKGDLELDKTNVQSDYSIMGAEFVNFIATLMTARIVKKLGGVGLLDKLAYKDVMDDLASAWRYTDASKCETPQANDRFWIHTTNVVKDMLVLLGLAETDKKTPKKRGRPKKEKPIDNTPKRPRGRPRKTPISVS